MRAFQREFLDLALELGALRFGEFTLKSGRNSPYFFNAGLFSSGYAAAKISRYYASAIADSEVEFDMLFGPAYKGIPLVTLAAAALAEHHDVDVPYAFNRKESKGHGEGGSIVGAPLAGKVLIVDDVFDTGNTIKTVIDELGHRARGNTPEDIRIAVPWYKPERNETDIEPDYFVRETAEWLVFPHELDALSPEELRQERPEIAAIIEGAKERRKPA